MDNGPDCKSAPAGGCCQAWKKKNSLKGLAALYYFFFFHPKGLGLTARSKFLALRSFFFFMDGFKDKKCFWCYRMVLKAILKVQFQHQVTAQPKNSTTGIITKLVGRYV